MKINIFIKIIVLFVLCLGINLSINNIVDVRLKNRLIC